MDFGIRYREPLDSQKLKRFLNVYENVLIFSSKLWYHSVGGVKVGVQKVLSFDSRFIVFNNVLIIITIHTAAQLYKL